MPRRIVCFALLMMRDAEKALPDRFAAACDLLGALFPQWRLGTDYQGWCDAQLLYLSVCQPALAKRPREQRTNRLWCCVGR